MSENEPIESETSPEKSVKEKLCLQNTIAVMYTLLAVLFAAVLYMFFEVNPMPILAVGFFSLGLAPALAVIAIVGAIRGPLAGFLAGYIGEQLSSIFLSGGIIAFSMYGVAIGFLGLVVGLTTYDFTSGRSLAKLSVLSAIGVIFAALITTVVGLYVEQVAVLVAIGLQLLPFLTIGLPTVILLTPLFARFWDIMSDKIPWPW
ncbi:MAG: hypothetical protein E4H14_01595 [Candidatus Thorarchaeota archaeon]|nr:MAG: hypothetical protein E4H14_01595 [Candidatus Thorarchaeota archaeon]